MKRARPHRKCIGCGTVREKGELIRLFCDEDGEIRVDIKGTMGGRGAYVCRDRNCIEKACDVRRLCYAFRRRVKVCSPDLILSAIEGE